LNNELNQLDIQDILQLLPHRYPFLMVDRVVHYEMSEERKVLRAIKNVSFNEPFFQGHFPEKPVFPWCFNSGSNGSGYRILAFRMVGKPNPGELYYFASIDNARFKRPVVPGDQLVLDVEYLKERRGIAKFTGVATVDGEIVCSAELMCAKR
jgi:3-hydroxyacyl-[acyl-carrier-protein] dehydratase (EC 4.2.1.-)